jgi:chromosome segregation ATPase
MTDVPRSIEEIEGHISALRENLRRLVEQAAHSAAADDELMSERIAEQQAQLEISTKRRAELASAPRAGMIKTAHTVRRLQLVCRATSWRDCDKY